MGKEAIGGGVTFSATWGMRHDPVWDDVVFETVAKVSGAPGTWTGQARTPRTIPILAIKLEHRDRAHARTTSTTMVPNRNSDAMTAS